MSRWLSLRVCRTKFDESRFRRFTLRRVPMEDAPVGGKVCLGAMHTYRVGGIIGLPGMGASRRMILVLYPSSTPLPDIGVILDLREKPLLEEGQDLIPVGSVAMALIGSSDSIVTLIEDEEEHPDA